jgi:hypothetical protein
MPRILLFAAIVCLTGCLQGPVDSTVQARCNNCEPPPPPGDDDPPGDPGGDPASCPGDQIPCGGSCRSCPGTPNGFPTCANSACGLTCASGYTLSGSSCLCGGTACPGDPHGTSTCVANSCGISCNYGYSLVNGTCAPPIQDLPQGLTCGVAYANHACSWWPFVAAILQDIIVIIETVNNDTSGELVIPTGPECDPDFVVATPCNGAPSVAVGNGSLVAYAPAAGFRLVHDGDLGTDPGRGMYHQEYVNGVTDPALADRFNLPAGAVCGFHHSTQSPGKTCMGYDPAGFINACPPGWDVRHAFDANGGYADYWAWCEYRDWRSYASGIWPVIAPSGTACGMTSNDGGSTGSCKGVNTDYLCPPQMFRSGFFDDGRSEGRGLGWCATP